MRVAFIEACYITILGMKTRQVYWCSRIKYTNTHTSSYTFFKCNSLFNLRINYYCVVYFIFQYPSTCRVTGENFEILYPVLITYTIYKMT